MLRPVLTFPLPDLAPCRVRVPGCHNPNDCVDGGIFIDFQLVDGFWENRWFIRILNCDLHRCCVLEGSTAAGLRADVDGFHFEGVSPFTLKVQRLFGFKKKKIGTDHTELLAPANNKFELYLHIIVLLSLIKYCSLSLGGWFTNDSNSVSAVKVSFETDWKYNEKKAQFLNLHKERQSSQAKSDGTITSTFLHNPC